MPKVYTRSNPIYMSLGKVGAFSTCTGKSGSINTLLPQNHRLLDKRKSEVIAADY